MPNAFSKEEVVAFEQLLEGFHDALVLSKAVNIYNTDQTMMARTNDVIWRPQPYIANSISSTPGTTISGFANFTQLSVPVSISQNKTVPWKMNTLELRDALQEGRLYDAAKQRLASDINVALMNSAANLGSLVVPISGAAGDYDDIAQCDAIMNEQGVSMTDRYLALSSRDYNGLAGNIASSNSRSFSGSKSNNAFENSYVGRVAGFDTLKLDYNNRIAAAAGGGSKTIDTRSSANNYYVPKATSTAATGEVQNVDNRFQTITVSSTTNIAAGDAFTIGGVVALHHITKQSTGQLKTFRVVSITNGTQMVITPAIISNQGSTDAEAQYQNVSVTPSATAAITFLNANAANVNVFWQKDALEIIPGRLAVQSGAGVEVMSATTPQGVQVVLQKQYILADAAYAYRVDTLFGVANKQPEMSGILLFNQ